MTYPSSLVKIHSDWLDYSELNVPYCDATCVLFITFVDDTTNCTDIFIVVDNQHSKGVVFNELMKIQIPKTH